MGENKPKNAALVTALAFHYQMLIGLEKCFLLQEGQSIWFEKDGDVSFDSPDVLESSQTEVKDYTAALTNHHENLWKTLKNWLDPKFDHSKYGALVLHTTQAFGKNTRLKDWNNKSAEERLQILKDIVSERTEDQLNDEKPSEVIKLQKTVMSSDETLLKVLGKVTLHTQADNEQDLQRLIRSRLVGIPQNNLKNYLHGLIGFVYAEANQQCWVIKYGAFSAKCEELTAHLCKRTFTFPDFSGSEATEYDIDTYRDKVFVQKITDIEHDEVVPEAVGNWLELQNSLFLELDEHVIYKEKTINYQNQLVRKFKRDYSSAELEAINTIKSSKLLYNRCTSEQPLNMGNDIPPIEYRNGLIHDVMDDDDRDLKWRVEP